MSSKEWVVRATSYFEGSERPFSRTEITVDTRAEARPLLQAQKLLSKHAILRTEVELFRVKLVPFDNGNFTKFYNKVR